MKQSFESVEVLTFTRGDNRATIATNGKRHVSEECAVIKEHASLSRAISYLECKGYVISTENSRSV